MPYTGKQLLKEDVNAALRTAQGITPEFASRELSLVITKLQEAMMWAEEIKEKEEP